MRPTDRQRENAFLRELKALREHRFEGNLSATARALDVTSAYLSNVLQGKRGIGLKLVYAVARLEDRNVGELLGDPQSGTPWRKLAGWSESIESARRMYPGVSDAAWDWLGDLRGRPPPLADAIALGALAQVWDQVVARSGGSPSGATVSAVRTKTG